MWKRKALIAAIIAPIALAPLGGCEDLPGDEGTQGAVIGGLGGAAAGAMIGGEDNRLVGALIGGALGAGGGYLIGANMDKITGDEEEEAQQAVREAQFDPATPEDVRGATTADLNNDGFVTLDEVVAMEEAGLTDQEMIDRLEATGQVFELNDEQERYLTERGISPYVVNRMAQINQEDREWLFRETQNVIGQEPIEEPI